jgi:hypothetical protein
MAIEILLRRTKYAPSEGDGFNGQIVRKRIFRDIMALSFDAIVETGTFMGSTTGYMSEVAGLPIHSCEARRLFHLAAKSRLSRLRNIRLAISDSRTFLRSLAKDPLTKQRVFFYLDAHWYADLPLEEEIDIIGAHWKNCLVMIDDFSVMHDGGYTYDDYGPGRALSMDLIERVVRKHGLVAFAPSAPSSEETGAKRGCVVLATPGMLADAVASLECLRAV